jgi:hypothetical protein
VNVNVAAVDFVVLSNFSRSEALLSNARSNARAARLAARAGRAKWVVSTAGCRKLEDDDTRRTTYKPAVHVYILLLVLCL